MNWGDIFSASWIANFWSGFGLMLESLVGVQRDYLGNVVGWGLFLPMLFFVLAIAVAGWIVDAYLQAVGVVGDGGEPGLRGLVGDGLRGAGGPGVSAPHVTAAYSSDFHPTLNPWGVSSTKAADLVDPNAPPNPFANKLALDEAHGFRGIAPLPENAALITADDHLFGSDKLKEGDA